MKSFNRLKFVILYYSLIINNCLKVLQNIQVQSNHNNVFPKLCNKSQLSNNDLKCIFCAPSTDMTNEYDVKEHYSIEHYSIKVNERFTNPWDTWKFPSLWETMKMAVETDKSNIPELNELDKTLPILSPDFKDPPKDKIQMTWIGHSTLVVRFDNISIITDPMFSERASIVQFAGPKRFRSAACTVDELPHIDAVVISHNHYDHFDLDSVKDLNKRFGPNLHWFVPLEMSSWMRDAGCVNVIDMDWWSQSCISQKSHVKFVFTPAQHWSGLRAINDYNRALWGGWAVIGPNHRFFFAGDSGYCSVFKAIGSAYGPFDLAAIPIGAYEPKWYMRSLHVDPEDAVRIHADVKSQKSIGIHWGTFPYGYENYLEPKVKLKESVINHNLPLESFTTLIHGQTISV